MVLENINQDLISYYPLNETGGTRVDSVGSNDLSDNATVTSNPGQIGTAAQFTAANSEYLNVADNPEHSFADEDFAIAGWFYLDSKAANLSAVTKWNVQTVSREYALSYLTVSDRFAFSVSGDGSAFTELLADDFGSPSTGVWHFIVVEHNATSNEISIQINNGTVDTTAHTTGVNDGTADFRLGALVGGAGNTVAFWDGRQDEIAIWERLLTTTERTELYNNGNGVDLSELLGLQNVAPASIGGYVLASVAAGMSTSGFIGGYVQSEAGTDSPSGIIGGYTQGQVTIGPTGIIGGYAESRGFLVPDGNIGGFVFAKSTEQNQLFAILGGYLNALGTALDPASFGGFALSVPITPEDPRVIGGAASGLFQETRSIGGYSFGQPDFTNFVATRGRTLVIATSEDVTGQELNVDAQIVFKGLSAGNFNAKLDNIKTSQGEVIAVVQVEKFQLPPTVFIQSVNLLPASGETGPLNTLSPGGARQVCVTASGFLNDGDEFISAHIDFADPFTNQPGTANKPFLSVSGFTGPPPWTACHDYDMSGIYKITARAQDNRGMVGMDLSGIALTSGLTAGIHYPVVDISGTPRFGEVPPSMLVNFTLTSSGLMTPPFTSKESNNSLVQSPTDDRILWQFGNRERSLKKNPFTFYQSPGLFAPKVMYKFNHPSGFGRIMVSDSLLIGFVR